VIVLIKADDTLSKPRITYDTNIIVDDKKLSSHSVANGSRYSLVN